MLSINSEPGVILATPAWCPPSSAERWGPVASAYLPAQAVDNYLTGDFFGSQRWCWTVRGSLCPQRKTPKLIAKARHLLGSGATNSSLDEAGEGHQTQFISQEAPNVPPSCSNPIPITLHRTSGPSEGPVVTAGPVPLRPDGEGVLALHLQFP